MSYNDNNAYHKSLYHPMSAVAKCNTVSLLWEWIDFLQPMTPNPSGMAGEYLQSTRIVHAVAFM